MKASRTLSVLAVLMLGSCGSESSPPGPSQKGESGLDVIAALAGGADDAGFARAVSPRVFTFPADHGPHEGFRTEWWYLTGTLFDAERRAFGFQLTFFRNALVPPASRSVADMAAVSAASAASAWRSSHVWMGHLAISDERGGRFRFAERFSREALGLAGAEPGALAIHLQDWRLAENRLVARQRLSTGDLALDLVFEPGRSPVLQGDAGLSAKGPEPGNASYYYSMPRLETRGAVTLDGGSFEVSGLAWLDREWSTSALGPDLAGWDWFALQLDDGRDLMFYRLRRRDGTSDSFSAGSIVRADGSVVRLGPTDVELSVDSRFETADGAAEYPSTWRLRVPGQGLDLRLTPRVRDQELRVTVRYWEGAVRVEDPGGRSVGSGFVEMTGYLRPG